MYFSLLLITWALTILIINRGSDSEDYDVDEWEFHDLSDDKKRE